MSEEGDDKLLGLLGKMMGNIARSAVENARLLQEVSGTRADTAATCLPSTERVPAVAPQAYPHSSAKVTRECPALLGVSPIPTMVHRCGAPGARPVHHPRL